MTSGFREKWEKYGPRIGILAIAAFAIISTTVVTLQRQEEVRRNSFSVYAAMAEQRRAENAERSRLADAESEPSQGGVSTAAEAPEEQTVEDAPTETAAEPERHRIYASPSGKRYHYDAKCPGKNSAEITWDDAQQRGLTPCKKCAS